MGTLDDIETQAMGAEEGKDFWGVIGENFQETDFQFCGATNEFPKARNNFYTKETEYNQNEAGKCSCTVHGAMGAVSDLTGFVYSTDKRKEIWQEAISSGADPEVGWYVYRAVDLLRKTYNAENDEQLMTFVLEIGSTDFYKALALGYSVVCAYRGNTAYGTDFTDGILDGVTFGNTTYGHCVRMTYDRENDTYEVIVDNYKGRTTRPNRYKIPKANLEKLIANRVFFSTGYIFVIKSDFDALNDENEIPLWAKSSVEKAKKLGMTKWSLADQNEVVGTATLEAMLVKAGVLSQTLGNVSKLRFVVAMERMGQLGS